MKTYQISDANQFNELIEIEQILIRQGIDKACKLRKKVAILGATSNWGCKVYSGLSAIYTKGPNDKCTGRLDADLVYFDAAVLKNMLGI